MSFRDCRYKLYPIMFVLAGCAGWVNLKPGPPDTPCRFSVDIGGEPRLYEIWVWYHPESVLLWRLRISPAEAAAFPVSQLEYGRVPSGMDQLFPENGKEPAKLKSGKSIGISVHFIDYTGILTIPNGRSSKQYFQRVDGQFREIEVEGSPSFPPKWTSEADRDLHLKEIDDEVSGEGGRGSAFLTIARDPNADEAAKRTIAALLREARRQDPEEAYRELRIRDGLTLWGAGISDLRPLADFTNLTSLVLSSQDITDLTPLSSLTNLEFLRLEKSAIQDIAPLRTLIRLEELKLSGNRVSDLTPLAGMDRLYRLALSKNRIADLSGLEALAGLRDLDLSENNVRDLGPLGKLKHLHTLNASRNQIVVGGERMYQFGRAGLYHRRPQGRLMLPPAGLVTGCS